MVTSTIRMEGLHADVSHAAGEARVLRYEESTVGADRLRQVVERAGHTAGDPT